jgi:hypothetical protein
MLGKPSCSRKDGAKDTSHRSSSPTTRKFSPLLVSIPSRYLQTMPPMLSGVTPPDLILRPAAIEPGTTVPLRRIIAAISPFCSHIAPPVSVLPTSTIFAPCSSVSMDVHLGYIRQGGVVCGLFLGNMHASKSGTGSRSGLLSLPSLVHFVSLLSGWSKLSIQVGQCDI